MNRKPLGCPGCKQNYWCVLRASDTGAFALNCNYCGLRFRLGVPRDVPTLDESKPPEAE